MCMGCASNADFLVTSGILGGASLRVAARRFLPVTPRWARKVTDHEADAFLAGLQPEPGAATTPDRGATSRAQLASEPLPQPVAEPVLADR